MGSKVLRPPILDEKHAAFIARGLSTVASSTTSRGLPVIGRAAGCRVSTDRRQVTLLIDQSQSPALIDAISSSGRIAVVFSEPTTHRTIQLKSGNASVAGLQKRDEKLIREYADAFVAHVCSIGFEESLVRALIWSDRATLAAVTFTPEEVFEQTPGPGAGKCMASSK
ncbi:MAG TPA: hypothetical protein VFD22_04335 [Gemmatimonadaceae bacterium]|nr:hypothetical protein [Gemmatimonadaceae bacterium]